MLMTATRHQSWDPRLALDGQFSRPASTSLGFYQPNRLHEFMLMHRDTPGSVTPHGAPADPWQLKALAPYLYELDRVRRRFGKELRRKPGRSKLSQSRWAALKNNIDAKLRTYGGPFLKRFVREQAFQLINPHRRWPSGIAVDSRVKLVKLEDAIHWIPKYEATYGRDPDMTPAFAALIEAAKELNRLQIANPKAKGGQLRSTSAVLDLLSRFGFITNELSMAAKLLVATPEMTKAKPKRKTASIKKSEPHVQGA